MFCTGLTYLLEQAHNKLGRWDNELLSNQKTKQREKMLGGGDVGAGGTCSGLASNLRD